MLLPSVTFIRQLIFPPFSSVCHFFYLQRVSVNFRFFMICLGLPDLNISFWEITSRIGPVSKFVVIIRIPGCVGYRQKHDSHQYSRYARFPSAFPFLLWNFQPICRCSFYTEAVRSTPALTVNHSTRKHFSSFHIPCLRFSCWFCIYLPASDFTADFTSDTLRSYFFLLFAEVGRTRSMDAHKNSIRNAAIFFVRFIIYIAPFYDIFIFLYSLSFHATSSISFACMICKTAVYITPLLCAQPFITWYYPYDICALQLLY